MALLARMVLRIAVPGQITPNTLSGGSIYGRQQYTSLNTGQPKQTPLFHVEQSSIVHPVGALWADSYARPTNIAADTLLLSAGFNRIITYLHFQRYAPDSMEGHTRGSVGYH